MRTRSHRGFTLLEVLVALVVLAIALTASIELGTRNTDNAARLEDKTLAHWVAMNQATQLQLAMPVPAAGAQQQGKETMLGREWYWRTKVVATNDPDVRRLSIEVRGRPQAHDVLAALTAYAYVQP